MPYYGSLKKRLGVFKLTLVNQSLLKLLSSRCSLKSKNNKEEKMNAVASSKVAKGWRTKEVFETVSWAIWLLGVFLISQVTMSWWAFEPEYPASGSFWVPSKYQLVQSSDEATCFGPNCDMHIRQMSVSQEVFQNLTPHLEQVFVVPLTGWFTNILYVGKEKAGDTRAYTFTAGAVLGWRPGYIASKSSVSARDGSLVGLVVRDWVQIAIWLVVVAVVWFIVVAFSWDSMSEKLFPKQQ